MRAEPTVLECQTCWCITQPVGSKRLIYSTRTATKGRSTQIATQNKAVRLRVRIFKLFVPTLCCTNLLTEHHYHSTACMVMTCDNLQQFVCLCVKSSAKSDERPQGLSVWCYTRKKMSFVGAEYNVYFRMLLPCSVFYIQSN